MIEPSGAAPLRWVEATIEGIAAVTPRIRAFTLRTPWTAPFRPGQYVDVRLTAPDGYQAQRSYSVASAPGCLPLVELMVQQLADGEVSGFFHEAAAVGDVLEIRGPIGGPFTWVPADGGPLLLAGGGSGVVPLLSMLRCRAEQAPGVPAVLLSSASRAEEAIGHDELLEQSRADPLFHYRPHLTREPGGADGPGSRRIDGAAIGEALAVLGGGVPRAYVCGSTGFVGTVAGLLVEAGVPAARIRTERFG